MLIAYREKKKIIKTLTNAEALIEVKGEPVDILAAANYVENEDMTPFDALHLAKSRDEVIVSSDDSYDGFSDRIEMDPDR